jgi:hypothetical protein
MKESEQPGGHAAERLREFLRQRFPSNPDTSPGGTQAETEQVKGEEPEHSQTQTGQDRSQLPQKPDSGAEKPG